MKNFRAAWRMFLFFGLTFGIYALWYIGAFFIPNRQYWRQLIFRHWGRGFVWLAKINIKVLGTPPRPPFFLVSNHLSYADIPIIRAVVEGVYVAKNDIEGWFLAGTMIRNIGNIYINRKNKRDIPRAGLEILNALERGEGVIVFPEGTSTKGETVLPFKSSFFEFAAKSDLPVHYSAISYQTAKDELPPSVSVCWWDDTPLGEHLWRFFQLKEVDVLINFGEQPIHSQDRKELANELTKAIREKFIPVL